MNSFHDSVKAKMPADRMPGTASGKMMRTMAAEARGPVDARALLELPGDGLEVAHQQPGTERHQEGRVGEDQRPGVSPSWNVRMMLASGMKSSVGGTR